MIAVLVLGLGALLFGAALHRTPRGVKPRVYLCLSALPVLMTFVAPAPFALSSLSPNDLARQIAVTISRVGVTLSVSMVAAGILMAVRAGDRRAATLFLIEGALAGLPAALFVITAVLFRA